MDVTNIHPKPPEEYHVIKNSLLNFVNSSDKEKMNKNIAIINDAVLRVNEIVIHTYQFLRLFSIKGQKINEEFVEINRDIVSMAMKVFIEDTKRGRSVLGKNKEILEFFSKFYKDEYEPLYDGKKINGTNLSGIFNYVETEIVTAIENNVKVHFVSYVNRYVNCCFKEEHDKLLENLKGKEKESLKTQLKNELRLVKNDLIERTSTRDPKYNNWFYDKYLKILPNLKANSKNGYICDLKSNPQKYIPYMKIMSEEIIKMGYNSFQYFPLRTEIVPKYIPIDTKTLIDLLVNNGTNKNTYFKDMDKYKHELWSSIFNFKNKMFDQNGYKFDYRILTDGFAVSVQFIHDSYGEKNDAKKANLKKGREKANKEYKNKDRKEIEKLKNEKNQKNKNYKTKKIEKQDDNKNNFKKLNDEAKAEVIKKIKEKTYVEFPYLEELNEKQLEELKKLQLTGLVVYVDPGKKNLLYMMNDKGVYFRYSISERIHETKRLEYQNKLLKYKNENGMIKIESELSGYNSKSCDVDEFKKYIKKKNEINLKLKEKYIDTIFRKYKWYGTINKKRSEDILLNKIEKVYGKNIIMIYGDWSIGKQKRNFISTPNKGLKKKLATRFTIYSIDEFKTSKINYKSLEETENLYLPDRKGTLRKKHSILTYKTENGRQGCMNRDKSAVNGMKLITDYFLKEGERHPSYKRESKKTTKAIDLETSEKKSNKLLRTKNTKKESVKENNKKKLLVSNVSKGPDGNIEKAVSKKTEK